MLPTSLRRLQRTCVTRRRELVVGIALCLFLYVYVDSHLSPDRYLSASPQLSALELKSLSWLDLENDGVYFKPRDTVVAPLPRLVITPTTRCSESSFMVAMVSSPPEDYRRRELIRNTWAAAVRSGQWPGGEGEMGVTMDVVFVLGLTTAKENGQVAAEAKQYNDLIVGEFHDTYRNLTLKTLTGLSWVSQHCLHTDFVVKVDQDTLVDFPRLTAFLSDHQGELRNTVIGKLYFNSERREKGKWRVTTDEYPFSYYPTFAGGPCYIISTDAVPKMVNVSRYLPTFSMEDVHVTGVLAHAAHVRQHYMQQLQNWYQEESACVLLARPSFQVSLTDLSHDRLRHVWDVLTSGVCKPFPK